MRSLPDGRRATEQPSVAPRETSRRRPTRAQSHCRVKAAWWLDPGTWTGRADACTQTVSASGASGPPRPDPRPGRRKATASGRLSGQTGRPGPADLPRNWDRSEYCRRRRRGGRGNSAPHEIACSQRTGFRQRASSLSHGPALPTIRMQPPRLHSQGPQRTWSGFARGRGFGWRRRCACRSGGWRPTPGCRRSPVTRA